MNFAATATSQQGSDPCKWGCDTVLPEINEIRRPPTPQNPPVLRPSRTTPDRPAGIYSIKDYQVQTHSGSREADISGALFKVEVNSTTNLFLYQVQLMGRELKHGLAHIVSILFAWGKGLGYEPGCHCATPFLKTHGQIERRGYGGSLLGLILRHPSDITIQLQPLLTTYIFIPQYH